ncbi:unnamed protein product [Nezara viridula]|uniref:Tetratricopeptide repeat protein 29 n=1 Tax=Nezara viridula TaxID=85310 RepID=A0A9P0H859_NEZVI|nr:unnamed protein product [Nezara viridula]
MKMRNIDVKYDKNKIWSVINKHLDEDYRDPIPRPLPDVAPESPDSIVCIPNKKKPASIRVMISETAIWDALRDMGVLRQRAPKSYTSYRNKQREIIFNQPELTNREIRRMKMKPKKYVLFELLEEGYRYAAHHLKKLMDEHDRLREPIPPEQIKDKPLKNMKKTVIFLGEILKQANIYKEEHNNEGEFSIYFYTAKYYEDKNNPYWTWLADSFYKNALKTAKSFDLDGGYSKAFINYMYGRFLLKQGNAPQAAKRLQIAFELSIGKPWGAMWATNITFEKINEYSSYLLHIAQLLTADKIYKRYPERALRLTIEAVRHARRGDWHPDLEEAMLELAIHYTRNRKHSEAINTLVQLSEKVDPTEDRNMFISIQVLLALCYKRGRKKGETLKQLFFLVELGRKWKLPNLVAFGHKNIAQYLMEKNRIVSARKYLTSCILLFKKQQRYKDLVESVYLLGSCKAEQHIKEYIELMIDSDTPDTPGYKKILDFLSYGKPFWKEKTLKRYIVTKTIEPLISQKEVLTASDKIYLLLKDKFGEQFADYAMEEITEYGRKPLSDDKFNYILEDPTEIQYFETRKEAEAYKAYLVDKYRGKNLRLNRLRGENINFQIGKREIEDESEEKEYIKTLNDIDPIIPYEKDSPMYKQALTIIKDYLTPPSFAETKKPVILNVTDPKILIRLMNTIVDSSNVLFKFDGPINYEAILAEVIKQRSEQRKFVESLPELLHKRYSTEIPVTVDQRRECTIFPEEAFTEYDSDRHIEKNRDILYNSNFYATM